MSSYKWLSQSPSTNKIGATTYHKSSASAKWLQANSSPLSKATFPALSSNVGNVRTGIRSLTLRGRLTYVNSGRDFPTGGGSSAINTGIAYGDGRFIYGWVRSGAGGWASSTDAINWTTAATTDGGYGQSAYGNGLYLIGGAFGDLITSTNSLNWTARSSGTSADVKYIQYGDGKYVFATSSAGFLIRSSTNGINWTTGTGIPAGSTPSPSVQDLSYGNGRWLVADISTGTLIPGQIYTSTNSLNYSATTVNTARDTISTVGYGNGTYLAGSNGGMIYKSTNASNWELLINIKNVSGVGGRSSDLVADRAFTISYQENIFLIGTRAGKILVSDNLTDWDCAALESCARIVSITYGNGIWVVHDELRNNSTLNLYDYNTTTEFVIPETPALTFGTGTNGNFYDNLYIRGD
jgi:hypothetical protein